MDVPELLRRLDPLPGSSEELRRFADLQRQLQSRFQRFTDDVTVPYTAVVIPSQSFDPRELAKIDGVAHYEERSLFNLMLMRHPRLRVVFVTSKRIDPLIVDYYLHQMRGVPPAHARRRLLLLDCDDATPRPLTEKILERPRLLRRIKDAIDDPEMAHLVHFNSTPLERTLAVQLGIPMNATDPSLSYLGTKSGCRKAFARAGIPVAEGREDLRDEHDVAAALAEVWEARPHTRRMVVKLDDSFSGEGNALLDLAPLHEVAPGGRASSAQRAAALEAALPSLRFEAKGLGWEEYRTQLRGMGGVCEAWIEGEGKRSPSVQLRINPAHEVQAISTHDQVLGGPSGQIFQGATFPADPSYRLEIQALGEQVGQVLADDGVIGRFAVDFLVVPASEPGTPPRITAVEINLRQGGTTHCFNTLRFITDGRYERETGRFLTRLGHERAYFATDTIQQPRYRGLLPFDLIDLLVVNGIHVGADDTGVVFHLLGCLSQYGKLGCTAISHTPEQARALYERTLGLLDALANDPVGTTPLVAPIR
ncbi:MAG: carboxylate-amine ligase [Myxococcales bacterium]|nr:carboxylate-amine ligase [Myxococcales bacterium]